MMGSNKPSPKMGRKEFLLSLMAAGLAGLSGGWLGNLLASARTGSKGEFAPDLPPSKSAAVDAGRQEQAFNLLDYGADPTGDTDSTEAFRRALRAVEAAVRPNKAAEEAGDRNQRGRIKLYIPEGSYLITKPEALMSRSFGTRTLGFVIQGAGRGITQILYRNTEADRPLLYNRDAWMGVTVADIEFVSDRRTNTFMYSYSRGGAQNYTFERCVWSGSWRYLFQLEGTNTNSEMTWYHCNFNGAVEAAVFVPGEGGDSSDQFVNYNFIACQFEVEEGDYLVFGRGGNVNVWGGSLIHYDNVKGGTFFRLLNGSHGLGVQRFLCIGARFEHRSANSRLIQCEWNDGTVLFISCDMSSQAYRVEPAVLATFHSSNAKMPIVKFESCMLMGKHAYSYLRGSWAFPHQVVYDNCEFAHSESADEFIVYTTEESVDNKAGRPLVVFRQCRSLQAQADGAFFDTDYGFRTSNRAQLTPKLISIKDSTGCLPSMGAEERFRLPVGAVILSVRWLCRPGATQAGAADYWIETSEAVPQRIVSLYSPSVADGFNRKEELLYECDTEARASLRLCAGSDTPRLEGAHLFLSYIG